MGNYRLAIALLFILSLFIELHSAPKIGTELSIEHSVNSIKNIATINTKLSYYSKSGAKFPLANKPIIITINTSYGEIEDIGTTNVRGEYSISYAIKPGEELLSVSGVFEGDSDYLPSNFQIDGSDLTKKNDKNYDLSGLPSSLCIPLLILFSLMGVLALASGRNPFGALDLSSPRMPRKNSAVQKGLTFNFNQFAQFMGSSLVLASLLGISKTGENNREKKKITKKKEQINKARGQKLNRQREKKARAEKENNKKKGTTAAIKGEKNGEENLIMSKWAYYLYKSGRGINQYTSPESYRLKNKYKTNVKLKGTKKYIEDSMYLKDLYGVNKTEKREIIKKLSSEISKAKISDRNSLLPKIRTPLTTYFISIAERSNISKEELYKKIEETIKYGKSLDKKLKGFKPKKIVINKPTQLSSTIYEPKKTSKYADEDIEELNYLGNEVQKSKKTYEMLERDAKNGKEAAKIYMKLIKPAIKESEWRLKSKIIYLENNKMCPNIKLPSGIKITQKDRERFDKEQNEEENSGRDLNRDNKIRKVRKNKTSKGDKK